MQSCNRVIDSDWRNANVSRVPKGIGGKVLPIAGILLAAMSGCLMDDSTGDLALDEASQGLRASEEGEFQDTAIRGGGFVVVSGDDADDGGHCNGTRCGGIYPAFFKEAVAYSQSGGTGILAIGVNGSSALSSFNSWNLTANGGPGAPVTHARTLTEIANARFEDYAVIYLPSYDRQTSGGITSSQITAINARQPAIRDFVNTLGGSLIALTQSGASNAWGFLPEPLTTVNTGFTYAKPTNELLAISPSVTRANLSHCCFHNVFTGPVDPATGLYQGLKVLAVQDEGGTYNGKPVILGGRDIVLTAERCGDGIDNDGDGLVDKEDPDCFVCGDGVVDPNEQCDDGNGDDGDGCDHTCAIEANNPPVAVCRNATECNDPGTCAAAVTGLGAGSYDPDNDPISVVQSPAGPYSVGQHQVGVIVSDGENQDQCTAVVNVNDCEAPRIDCANDFRVECTGSGAAFVQPPSAGATDNCNNAAVDGPPATSLALGDHPLSYAASDDAGNTAMCTTVVTVEDTTPPAIACPSAVTAECAGNGNAPVDPGVAQVSDSCTSASVNTPGTSNYPLGTTSVGYTAVDQSGNQASCSTSVTVQDTTAPDIACPASSVVECTGNRQAAVDPGAAQVSDSCTLATVNTPGTSSYPLGTTTVGYTAGDQSGNQASCSTSVTVQDTTPPAIACPAPSVAECTGNGQAVVDPGLAQVADVCTLASVNTPGPDSYPLGTTDVAYTAMDELGNQATCSTSVTVRDTTPPDITCPAPIVVECTGNHAAPVTPGDAVASDICTAVDTVGPSAGSYPLGTTLVSYSATDQSGNQALCQTTISVVDTTPPVLSVGNATPLWPPNHKYQTIDLVADCGVEVLDQCGGILDPSITAPTITRVTSDEPENIISDGNTVNDIVIVDATTVKLRSERKGTGDGRVYNVHFQVVDGAGNITHGVCPISVPHDRGRGADAVDSGVAYEVSL